MCKLSIRIPRARSGVTPSLILFFNHRFAPTRPPVHWSGIHSTTGYGPVCPQAFPDISNASVSITKMPLRRLQYLRKIQPKLMHESEDCLYLNIYVPKGGKLILYFSCKLHTALAYIICTWVFIYHISFLFKVL